MFFANGLENPFSVNKKRPPWNTKAAVDLNLASQLRHPLHWQLAAALAGGEGEAAVGRGFHAALDRRGAFGGGRDVFHDERSKGLGLGAEAGLALLQAHAGFLTLRAPRELVLRGQRLAGV